MGRAEEVRTSPTRVPAPQGRDHETLLRCGVPAQYTRCPGMVQWLFGLIMDYDNGDPALDSGRVPDRQRWQARPRKAEGTMARTATTSPEVQ